MVYEPHTPQVWGGSPSGVRGGAPRRKFGLKHAISLNFFSADGLRCCGPAQCVNSVLARRATAVAVGSPPATSRRHRRHRRSQRRQRRRRRRRRRHRRRRRRCQPLQEPSRKARDECERGAQGDSKQPPRQPLQCSQPSGRQAAARERGRPASDGVCTMKRRKSGHKIRAPRPAAGEEQSPSSAPQAKKIFTIAMRR